MANIEQKKQNARNIFLNKYFNLIIAFVVIFILVLGFLLIIIPKYNNTKLLITSNISNQKKLFAQQKRKLDSLIILNELFGKIPVEDINKFNDVLPLKYQAEELFGEFEELINKGGWTLSSVSWTDITSNEEVEDESVVDNNLTDSKIGIIELNLQLQNIDYSGIKEVLKILENNLRLLDVVSVSFEGDSNAEIILYTYYYEK